MNSIIYLVRTTIEEFNKDNATQMSAALAYYALFAIPPILLISINILSIFLKDSQVQSALITQAQSITGGSTSEILRLVINHLSEYSDQRNIAQWLSVIAIFIAASGAFGHLCVSLNTIWDISPRLTRNFMITIEKRLTAMFFIFAVGFLIFVSFIANAILSIIGIYIADLIGVSHLFLQTVNILVTFVGIVSFISLIYKLIPEGNMAWRDIFVGAFVTSLLFLLGKYIIDFIIIHSTFSTIYGAASSLLILLIWIYYLSLIFFFGAEFTQVYSNLHGRGVGNNKGALDKMDKILLEKKNGK